jgi:hypothetical protein
MLYSIQTHMYIGTSSVKILINQIMYQTENMYHAFHLSNSFHYHLTQLWVRLTPIGDFLLCYLTSLLGRWG